MKALSKSLFFKVMTMNMAIIVTCLFLTAGICFNSIGTYLMNERAATLQGNIQNISSLTAMLLDNRVEPAYENLYQYSLETIAGSTNSTIFIINPSHKIFARTKLDSISINQDRLQNNMYISRVLNGESLKLMGTLDGLFRRSTLTVAQPIVYEKEIVGAAFMVVPTPTLQSIKSDIMLIFVFAAVVSAIFAFSLSYYFSKRIAKPLNAMSAAAKKITQGDFKQRVNDDIGDKISEVTALVEAFNGMAESIDHLEEGHMSFIASVSHELRTPMTSMIGFIEGILDGTIPPERQEQYLQITLSETKRLSRLVTDLLDVSRMENSQFKLTMNEMDINECIRQQLLRFEKQATKKELAVSVEFSHEDCVCLCDKDAITRVIINLLDNAMKFVPQGGYVKIKTERDRSGARIMVENSGDGIGQEDLKHIFDKFYKIDKSRGLDKNGVGLGLYLVQNIIRQHGESIRCESEPGAFTRFTFTLKLAK